MFTGSMLIASAAAASEVTLASFGASDATRRTWREQNDPVMGGKSVGTWTDNGDYGTMEGTCAIIPALQAPGFINARATADYADVSACTGLQLEVRSSSTPDAYTGYRINFGNGRSSCGKFFAKGYKANFAAPSGEAFGNVQVPFNEFTNCWSDATGDAITTCADDASKCPTSSQLQNLQSIAVWAEGVAGDVKLDVKSVKGYGCSANLEVAARATVVSFDGAKETTFRFKELNDPVMGGKSTGTWALGDGYGILDGEVVNVPALSAPGFIKAAGDGSFPDMSAFIDGSLVLSVRSTHPEYAGYRVTFVSGATFPSFSCAGGGSLPGSRGCFKNKFTVPAGDDFSEIKLPFNMFSDKWSSATGEQTTTCAEDSSVCPTAAKLAKLQRLEFWAEGASGLVHLEVQGVFAENAAGERTTVV